MAVENEGSDGHDTYITTDLATGDRTVTQLPKLTGPIVLPGAPGTIGVSGDFSNPEISTFGYDDSLILALMKGNDA